eukprot:CCRYP_013000-RF/>CCRYP_013000-RF protein AED:0.49 eAED:0.49 QI:0/-1/0/1/-1/0/1/0/10
MPSPVHYLTE